METSAFGKYFYFARYQYGVCNYNITNSTDIQLRDVEKDSLSLSFMVVLKPLGHYTY